MAGQILDDGVTQPSPKGSGVFRVLHTADWHLGKMLGDRFRTEEHRRFLLFLLERISALSVDALVIAGDVFDSANPPQSAAAQVPTTFFRPSSARAVVRWWRWRATMIRPRTSRRRDRSCGR